MRVDEEIRTGADKAAVIAGTVGETLEPAAVELDSIKIAGQMTIARAGEVDPAIFLVDRVERTGFPVATGHGADGCAILSEVINVLPAGALAEEEKRTILEEFWLTRIVDPGFGRFAEQFCRLAAIRFDGAD